MKQEQQLYNNIMAEVMKLERTSKSTKQTTHLPVLPDFDPLAYPVMIQQCHGNIPRDLHLLTETQGQDHTDNFQHPHLTSDATTGILKNSYHIGGTGVVSGPVARTPLAVITQVTPVWSNYCARNSPDDRDAEGYGTLSDAYRACVINLGHPLMSEVTTQMSGVRLPQMQPYPGLVSSSRYTGRGMRKGYGDGAVRFNDDDECIYIPAGCTGVSSTVGDAAEYDIGKITYSSWMYLID
ncbi:hypothetical protein CBL_14662 [Carabus blaptoides fortunei]